MQSKNNMSDKLFLTSAISQVAQSILYLTPLNYNLIKFNLGYKLYPNLYKFCAT